jgi:hypothetical protein
MEKKQPQTNSADATKKGHPIDVDHHVDEDEPETVRSSSQTSQDLSHTIRGGDDKTGPMKEFPT